MVDNHIQMELFAELKKGAIQLRNQQEQVDSLKVCSKREILEFKDPIERSYGEQLQRITEMVSLMLLLFTFICHLQFCVCISYLIYFYIHFYSFIFMLAMSMKSLKLT